MTNSYVTRRTLLQGGAAASLMSVLGLSACGQPISAVADTKGLTYWNLFAGGDGKNMVAMLKEFRQAYPKITLDAVTLAWGAPYYTKLAMASAGGRAPDLAVLHLTRVPTYALNMLQPFDLKRLEGHGIKASDLPADLLQRGSLEGELFAIPLDTHPVVLYYNTDICGEAGLLADDGTLAPLNSAEAFLDAGRKVAEVTGKTGYSFAGNDNSTAWRHWWTFYRQQGGKLNLPPGGQIEADDDLAISTIDFLTRFTDGTIASPNLDYQGAIASFVNGSSGLMIQGEWEVTTMETAGLNYNMQPVPNLFGRPGSAGDSHAFVLPRQLETDPERLDRAYSLVASLLRNSTTWAEGGHIPAYEPVAESEEYLSMKPQSNYRAAGESVQLHPEAWFSGSASELEKHFNQTIAAACAGTLTPKQAWEDISDWCNKKLQIPAPGRA